MIGRTSTSVSCRGDEIFRKALKRLAAENGVEVADLVRDAVDSVFGDRLQSHLAFFSANNEDKYPHLGTKFQEAVNNAAD